METYRDFMFHRKDSLKNRGFDWRGSILKKSMSAAIFAEEQRAIDLLFIERMINFNVDMVKNIKKRFMWIYDKKFNEFN